MLKKIKTCNNRSKNLLQEAKRGRKFPKSVKREQKCQNKVWHCWHFWLLCGTIYNFFWCSDWVQQTIFFFVAVIQCDKQKFSLLQRQTRVQRDSIRSQTLHSKGTAYGITKYQIFLVKYGILCSFKRTFVKSRGTAYRIL